MTVRAGARLSEDDSEKLHQQVSAALEGHEYAFGSYYDVKREEFVIDMVGDDSEIAVLRNSLPADLLAEDQDARIEVHSSPLVPQQYGGLEMATPDFENYCTSGFPVVSNDNINIKGILTAGHCPDVMVYQLYEDGTWHSGQWMDEIVGATRDVQWYVTGNDTQPEFYADNTVGTRFVGPRIPRSDQDGLYVCHRGTSTGYSCGTVESISYDDGCPEGEWECTATRIRVEGEELEGAVGDSGGPWFNADRPTGIHATGPLIGCGNGGADRVAVYMAIDYINQLGVTLYYAN